MEHLALYRKYRPHTFDEVVGQDTIVSLLKKAITDKKPSHAYLFCGGRGTGKTSIARIFARDVGCNPEDIIEIDAASNRGIDEIRELREAVRTHPFSSPYKVYIIDEVHMLTKEAANALLKTLEEPPSHVIFILATTDPEKLPATIVSRCQKVLFAAPSLTILAKHLVGVALQEGKHMSEEVAILIAKHGKGSYRDALGYLEQVIALSAHTTITKEEVSLIIGQPEQELIMELVEMFVAKETNNMVGVLQQLEKKSNALRTYDEILEILRRALLSRIGSWKGDERIESLGTTYATTIHSQLLLRLLEKRYLISVSEGHGWLVVESILLGEMSS